MFRWCRLIPHGSNDLRGHPKTPLFDTRNQIRDNTAVPCLYAKIRRSQHIDLVPQNLYIPVVFYGPAFIRRCFWVHYVPLVPFDTLWFQWLTQAFENTIARRWGPHPNWYSLVPRFTIKIRGIWWGPMVPPKPFNTRSLLITWADPKICFGFIKFRWCHIIPHDSNALHEYPKTLRLNAGDHCRVIPLVTCFITEIRRIQWICMFPPEPVDTFSLE
jgi:hypothetical protein